MAASEKVKVYKLGTEPAFPKDYDVTRMVTLNFTDIANNNNKYYVLNLCLAKTGQAQIYSEYARVGAPNPAKEIRVCDNEAHANMVIDKIIKEKTKKGYVEVKLVKAEVGSEVGKAIITSSTVSEDTAKKLGYKIQKEKKSTLHPKVQDLVKVFFGSIEKFVIDTLDTSKCALGQLSLEQINKGRDLLLDARALVNAGAKDITELNSITSKFYSNIPMNFGYRRLDANTLRFDTHDKLDAQFDILDTLEGAKNAEKVLTKRSDIDDKYASLKTGIEWMDPKDPIAVWLDLMFRETKTNNSGLYGKLRVSNVYKLNRPKEEDEFKSMLFEILKMKNQHRTELPNALKHIWSKRPIENKEYEKLMSDCNILPLFHGTRTPNCQKILSSKLMMRKPGFTVAGSMFDKLGGLYFASQSQKSAGYSSFSRSYWASGNDNKGYLFVSDVALGKQKIATAAYPYTLDGIKPNMSVWAKGSDYGIRTSLINDEFIVFTEKQNWLRYIIEFESGR